VERPTPLRSRLGSDSMYLPTDRLVTERCRLMRYQPARYELMKDEAMSAASLRLRIVRSLTLHLARLWSGPNNRGV
jgi:hypothetical protein